MPSDIVPLLTHNNLLDMLDFKEANQKAEVSNRLNGKSELTSLTKTSASIRLTSKTRIDLHLLPKAKGNYLIYMITTTETSDSLADSDVTVYDSSWKPAVEKHQLQSTRSSIFRSVVIDPESTQITIREQKFPLRFEGEDSDSPSSVQTEKHGQWDPVQAKFLFSD